MLVAVNIAPIQLSFTVKLGYNELGYYELPAIANKNSIVVWFRLMFSVSFLLITNGFPVITNRFALILIKIKLEITFILNFLIKVNFKGKNGKISKETNTLINLDNFFLQIYISIAEKIVA